jgi:hypothetical protein
MLATANARLARLRVLVPVTNAIVGVDLADGKQVVVFTDHGSKVLARRPTPFSAAAIRAGRDGKQAPSGNPPDGKRKACSSQARRRANRRG